MQTTFEVDDELLRQAEAEAAQRKVSLAALFEDALRERLCHSTPETRPRHARPMPVCDVPDDRWGLQPGLKWEDLPYLDDDGGAAPW